MAYHLEAACPREDAGEARSADRVGCHLRGEIRCQKPLLQHPVNGRVGRTMLRQEAVDGSEQAHSGDHRRLPESVPVEILDISGPGMISEYLKYTHTAGPGARGGAGGVPWRSGM